MSRLVCESQETLGVGLLYAFSDASLVKLEVTSFSLVHVSKVERETHNITLHSIVTLIIIVIDDVVVTVLKRGRDILEIIEVKRVRKDII